MAESDSRKEEGTRDALLDGEDRQVVTYVGRVVGEALLPRRRTRRLETGILLAEYPMRGVHAGSSRPRTKLV
jgi:hypothetical protein